MQYILFGLLTVGKKNIYSDFSTTAYFTSIQNDVQVNSGGASTLPNQLLYKCQHLWLFFASLSNESLFNANPPGEHE